MAGETVGGRPAETGVSSPTADPLARAVFLLLLAACFVAFFVTQRLKHTPTVVQRFTHSPTFAPGSSDPERQLERLSFKLARADHVTVTVIDAQGSTVATLLSEYPVPRYKQLSFRWNGHVGPAPRLRVLRSASGYRSLLPENGGALAPLGEYRVRIRLRQAEHTVDSPWHFRLVSG